MLQIWVSRSHLNCAAAKASQHSALGDDRWGWSSCFQLKVHANILSFLPAHSLSCLEYEILVHTVENSSLYSLRKMARAFHFQPVNLFNFFLVNYNIKKVSLARDTVWSY